jgi:hypothetical protein
MASTKPPSAERARATPSAAAARPQVATIRLDEAVQRGLRGLETHSGIKRPLDKCISIALAELIERQAATVKSELDQALKNNRAYRKSDPGYERAIRAFIAAEVVHAAEDPMIRWRAAPSLDRPTRHCRWCAGCCVADCDADGPRRQANLERVLEDVAQRPTGASRSARPRSRAGSARQWPAWMRRTPSASAPFRGEPGLERAPARLGACEGTKRAAAVVEVDALVEPLQSVPVRLDKMLPRGELPSRDGLQAVIGLAAWAHPEWVGASTFSATATAARCAS